MTINFDTVWFKYLFQFRLCFKFKIIISKLNWVETAGVSWFHHLEKEQVSSFFILLCKKKLPPLLASGEKPAPGICCHEFSTQVRTQPKILDVWQNHSRHAKQKSFIIMISVRSSKTTVNLKLSNHLAYLSIF